MTTPTPVRTEKAPAELTRLRERIARLPDDLRAELQPLADEAIDDAIFRGRALHVAREALERFRLDLSLTRFDLEATRRERAVLERRLGAV